jgi:DNA-binding LytR/AlgR family response regulator
MIWKCLIVDGDTHAIKIVLKYIEMVEQLEVVGTCSDAFQALAILQTEKIDLIVLDTQLPNISGTSFVKTLPYPPKVIFISALAEHAVDAFELGAVDYMLKPVTLERFLKAVNKVVNQNSNYPSNGHSLSFIRSSLFLKVNRKMIKVFFDEIIYVESAKDYIKIFRHHHPPLMVKQTLTALESILPSHLFIRIHRSYLVSVNCVTAITPKDVEIDNMEIPIGRQFLSQLKRLTKIK